MFLIEVRKLDGSATPDTRTTSFVGISVHVASLSHPAQWPPNRGLLIILGSTGITSQNACRQMGENAFVRYLIGIALFFLLIGHRIV